MQSNTKQNDIFSMWKEISELKFELEGSCACCHGNHPVHKCKGLCLLKGCVLKYMDISDEHYHQFKDCTSPEHKTGSQIKAMLISGLPTNDRQYAPPTLLQDRETAVFPSEPVITKWRYDPYSFTTSIVFE
jgi:hypothetical protein